MRFSRVDPPSFFNAGPDRNRVLQQRRICLAENSRQYAALLPSGEALLDETRSLAMAWDPSLVLSSDAGAPGGDPHDRLVELGHAWEPDFLMLQSDSHGLLRLVGGCVCFPSSWALEEKMGRTMAEIHDPVPGLNESMGRQIDAFLHRIRPGVAWTRTNWGMSRSPEWNQHPARRLPQLHAQVSGHEIWLRVEHQALVRLPKTDGILFGIRIAIHSLADIKKDTALTRQLRQTLQSMPLDLARYKNLDQARPAILRHLSD